MQVFKRLYWRTAWMANPGPYLSRPAQLGTSGKSLFELFPRPSTNIVAMPLKKPTILGKKPLVLRYRIQVICKCNQRLMAL